MPNEYTVQMPSIPVADVSGEIGNRLLRLLSVQAERDRRWIEDACRQNGSGTLVVPSDKGKAWPLHDLYNMTTCAGVSAVLAHFGEAGRTMGGLSRGECEQLGAAAVRAVVETHPVSGSDRVRPEWWHKWFCLRMDYLFGMGAWLLWDKLEPDTQLLTARILEHDADLYNEDKAPHLLYDDTQGESNAWTASGLVLASLMLKHHPHRDIWAEKAKEFMISAYATEHDVTSERMVDGKALSEWLRGPNAFPDYSVENHGFVHPIYMAAVSEMVRTAVLYRFAEEPVPEAATFNAEHVLDALIRLNLPDGNHFYVQGTDYDPRRLDSFLQTCNVVPLTPTPLREACFRRVLGNMETMARERPDMYTSGNVTFAFDFGTSWGLTENYLMRRLFGSPAEAVPDQQIESELTGVHVNAPGKFAIHRTARSLSSFSWHAIQRSSQVMGFTIPLDTDVLCSTQPADSYIGRLTEHEAQDPVPTSVLRHSIRARDDGFGITVELARCAGKVSQHCAFVSLPDGRSVYFELREAVQPVRLTSADSGNVYIYDDCRWPFQKRARTFVAADGTLAPEPHQMHHGNWLNVDDRMGYAAVGAGAFTLTKSEKAYHTWRLAFPQPTSTGAAQVYEPGRRINSFALISCPNQDQAGTESLAGELARDGWAVSEPCLLAVVIAPYLVYANFSTQSLPAPAGTPTEQIAPHAAGWVSLR